MNFRIVEGDYLQKYKEEFVELYNDSNIAVGDIPILLGISVNNMQRLRNECKEEGLIRLRPNRNKTKWEKQHFKPRYYHVHRQGKRVRWTIKKNGVYYGLVDTVLQAKKMVELLKDCNWNKSKAKEIKDFVMANY